MLAAAGCRAGGSPRAARAAPAVAPGVRGLPASHRLRADHPREQAHQPRLHRASVDRLLNRGDPDLWRDEQREGDGQRARRRLDGRARQRLAAQDLQRAFLESHRHRPALHRPGGVETERIRSVRLDQPLRRLAERAIGDAQLGRRRQRAPQRRLVERLELEQRRVQSAAVDGLPGDRRAHRLHRNQSGPEQVIGEARRHSASIRAAGLSFVDDHVGAGEVIVQRAVLAIEQRPQPAQRRRPHAGRERQQP